MLVESLIKETVELQGFRVVEVQQTEDRLEAKLSPDGRYGPRRVVCEHCGGVHVELLPWVAGKRQFTRALMVTLAT